jgi:hypothetical protein
LILNNIILLRIEYFFVPIGELAQDPLISATWWDSILSVRKFHVKTIRIQVETYDGCRTIWYEKSRLKNATEVISKRVNDQLGGLNLKRIEVSLSPATV